MQVETEINMGRCWFPMSKKYMHARYPTFIFKFECKTISCYFIIIFMTCCFAFTAEENICILI